MLSPGASFTTAFFQVAAPGEALALGLALDVRRVDPRDAHVEGALHGLLDLVLVRPLVDLEGVLPLRLDEVVAPLRDDRTDDYLVRIHYASSRFPASFE
jgi:hypothetical protein